MMAAMMSVFSFAADDAVARITLTGTTSGGQAQIILIENASYSAGYDNGYDAPCNINLAEALPKTLYMYSYIGAEKYSTIATNNLDGLHVDFITNLLDDEYTMTFEVFTLAPGRTLDIYDLDENQRTDIDPSESYTFNATSGHNEIKDRFIINYVAPVPTCTTVRTGMNIDQYYTLCLPKAVTAANGASFWNMSNRGAGVAYLEEAVLPLVAGRPYIIQAEDAELCVEYSGDEVAAGAYGALHGTLEPMDQAALNAAGSDIYLLKNNELRLVSDQSGNSLAANRAYIKYGDLVYSTPSPAPGRRVRAIPMQDQSTTGVENLNAAEAPVKTVIDGKMYILRGEHMFDATGRMVK